MTPFRAFAGGILTVVLLAAAIGKLADLRGFRRVLAGYGWIPLPLQVPISIVLPALEFVCAVVVWTPLWRPGALLTCAVLLSFNVVLVFAIATGRRVECGCFGSGSSDRVSGVAIARNIVLAVLSLAIVLTGSMGQVAGALVPALFAGVGSGLVIIIADQAGSVFRENWLRPESLESRPELLMEVEPR